MKISSSNNTNNTPYKSPGRSSTIAAIDDPGFPDFFNNGLLKSTNNNSSSSSSSKGGTPPPPPAPFRPLESFPDDNKETLSKALGADNGKTPAKSRPTQSRTSDMKRSAAATDVKSALPPVRRRLYTSDEENSSSSSSSTSESESDSETDESIIPNRVAIEKSVKEMDARMADQKTKSTAATADIVSTGTKIKSVKISDKPDIIITAPSPQSSPTTTATASNGKRSRAATEDASSTSNAEALKAYAGELEQMNEKKRKCEEQIRAYEEIQKTNYAALEEMATREDELSQRLKDLAAREKMVVEREAGLNKMRAQFTSLFA